MMNIKEDIKFKQEKGNREGKRERRKKKEGGRGERTFSRQKTETQLNPNIW